MMRRRSPPGRRRTIGVPVALALALGVAACQTIVEPATRAPATTDGIAATPARATSEAGADDAPPVSSSSRLAAVRPSCRRPRIARVCFPRAERASEKPLHHALDSRRSLEPAMTVCGGPAGHRMRSHGPPLRSADDAVTDRGLPDDSRSRVASCLVSFSSRLDLRRTRPIRSCRVSAGVGRGSWWGYDSPVDGARYPSSWVVPVGGFCHGSADEAPGCRARARAGRRSGGRMGAVPRVRGLAAGSALRARRGVLQRRVHRTGAVGAVSPAAAVPDPDSVTRGADPLGTMTPRRAVAGLRCGWPRSVDRRATGRMRRALAREPRRPRARQADHQRLSGRLTAPVRRGRGPTPPGRPSGGAGRQRRTRSRSPRPGP